MTSRRDAILQALLLGALILATLLAAMCEAKIAPSRTPVQMHSSHGGQR